MLDALRITDWRVRGFALGVAAHGIGTARAFQVHPEAGAYAGLAFGLHGVLAAVLFPPISLRAAALSAHQMRTRFSGGRYIASPGFTWNAA